YSGQPPLYAWIQHLAFGLFGRNLFSLALVKNGLLFLAYLFFWLTARRHWPDRPTLVSLTVLSWLLIPQVVWEAQRDLSHSVMVLTVSAATLYLVVRGLRSWGCESNPGPGVAWYAVLGLLVGLGMLSKYNFVVFAGALSLALLSLPEGRALVLNPRILVGLGCALVVSAPHFAWAVDHWEVAVRSLSKVDAVAGNNRIVGLGVLFLAVVSFLTPLWLMWAGFFPGLFRRAKARGDTLTGRLAQRYLVALIAGLTVGILALGVGHVKERWMIPLLFVAPLYFFSGAGENGLRASRVRWFRRVAAAAAVVTLVAAGLRSLLGPSLGVMTRVNYPFDPVARELSAVAPEHPYVLTHNTWFAGNLVKRLPGARGYVPGYVLPKPGEEGPVLVVWDAVRSEPLPRELREDLEGRFGLDPGPVPPTYLTFPYKFGAGREARVGYLVVDGSSRRPPT
ncbi:MAG: glycosyltransferase, partial [Gemmatimonadetes bacterium]|nr:glycosyltransferase [Gemmatimonadota bacterium]